MHKPRMAAMPQIIDIFGTHYAWFMLIISGDNDGTFLHASPCNQPLSTEIEFE